MVKLKWITPDADNMVAYMARVSNPDNQDNKETAPRLIRYLINHGHWSPFEMVNACVEITTTRDISRQILRHRSFSFQEFSGRYAEYSGLETSRECRLQDTKNRQSSLPCEDEEIVEWWGDMIQSISYSSLCSYEEAITIGIAKEVARAILPEGLTPTTMYMNGSLRSWIHYWEARCDEATQKEHRLIAEATRELILKEVPMIGEALK